MSKKHRIFSAEFKAKLAMDAMKEQERINQTCDPPIARN